MGYKFSQNSRNELIGVHPKLVCTVEYAIGISEQDFGVHDGIRNAAEQHALYKRGVSQKSGYGNSISMHQKQEDGYGHAVDLVPYVPGKGLVWDWDLIYPIARAMQIAAIETGLKIRWGGCWGYTAINDLSGDPENWVQDYVRRKMKAGKRAFNDGPHYEILPG